MAVFGGDGVGRPCFYDASAVAAFAPVAMANIRRSKTPAQIVTLDAAGFCLAASTAALVAAAKAEAPGCVSHLLTYLPTVLDAKAPEAKRANMPVGWASPAFDVLQLEDYDWVTAGDSASSAEGVAVAFARLGYPVERQHYLSGFVLRPEQAAEWGLIEAAAEVARARGAAETFLWALPQVMRDGFVHFDTDGGDEAVDAFDDVLFPLELGREAEVAPGFSTAILTNAGGRETRNAAWAEPMGGARWRLSRLLRGRRGTEASTGAQVVGDRFVVLEAEAARAFDLPVTVLGREVRVIASGIGDGMPVETRCVMRGASVVPPSPVHLWFASEVDGSATVRWTRRSRAGWRWIDGVDAPLAEEIEAYRVTVTADGTSRDVDVAEPFVSIMAAERIGSVSIAVRQRGVFGESRAAELIVPA